MSLEHPMLSIEGICSGYGKMEILHDVMVNVNEKEIVAIIGPNGAGKTTLLNTIYGLTTIFKGDVSFKGLSIKGFSSSKVAGMGIAYTPQMQNVFPTMTVEENLTLGAFLRKDKENVKGDVDDVFKLFPEIERRRRNLAKTLSGGERQMLAVARALVSKPKLILLDEPTTGLSPKATLALLKKVSEIRERGITVVLVEQNVKKALEISDRGYVLLSGKVVADNKSSDLLSGEKYSQLFFNPSSK